MSALSYMAQFNQEQHLLMQKRYVRRAERFRDKLAITFLDENSQIGNTNITVGDAREGKFVGSPIPDDLKRQWIQGTGPATKPRATLAKSLRNVSYALLSGADGWMFDGEDALGQTETMSLDNLRNLKLANTSDPLFLSISEQVATEMNRWSQSFLSKDIIDDVEKQLKFTTRIYRARGLHLDDRHIRTEAGQALSASITDLTLYVCNNYRSLMEQGRSVVLYLPKIQTAEEAGFWNRMLCALEDYLEIPVGTIKAYVLVEQLEATFQLMEIRAALSPHFVGFNTGRWDYINSVADAMAFDPNFINPNIEEIGMTYGYMRNYEDRVRRAVNTPDLEGQFALWQGGMEPNIPVGSSEGVEASMKKAVKGAEREREAGASGKWVAHWKMVHIVRPVWEKAGEENQCGRSFPPLTYTKEDQDGLTLLEDATTDIRGARNLISVALQYGNAFAQGFQAAALKPADFFNDPSVLYLMEDMATGEIRVSILWEWLHKGAKLTEADSALSLKKGDVFNEEIFSKLMEQEYQKLLDAKDKDVHDDSKTTTLPIARSIVDRYVREPKKLPWYIDLLNLNLGIHNLMTANERIELFINEFQRNGVRMTENLDFRAQDKTLVDLDDPNEYNSQLEELKAWMNGPRFSEIKRLYTAKQVLEQKGSIVESFPIAQMAAEGFYELLRSKFSKGEAITTFGPYSPGQAVAIKRMGIEGIYLGGWATSAKGSKTENPGPDLASYPLSQVPDEAAGLVRALLSADKNQTYSRSKMSHEDRERIPKHDFRPFIIADADTGHGGEAHVRNLVRRFVEVGVPGYHIEDQKPGLKKCGHQGGKVLVTSEEQIKRCNSARFQLDLMGVPGIIVARTDAEAASLLDSSSDERDQPFILGATNREVPSYRTSVMAMQKAIYDQGITDINGFLLYSISNSAYEKANTWLKANEVLLVIDQEIAKFRESGKEDFGESFDVISGEFHKRWEAAAGLKIYTQAVADQLESGSNGGIKYEWTVEQWNDFAKDATHEEAVQKAKDIGVDVIWDSELARTTEGYYQVRGGIDYAIAKSLAVAPYCDIIWMETKTANLADAKIFADAMHAVFPDKMLAYNLSPSFNWDTTGMTEDEMRDFPKEIGKLGFVFNFITYGGHQIDGVAGEEFATALKNDGMLALARIQRRLRLLESPYKTPQTLVGGNRMDGVLMATSGRTATTRAMGKGSTQFQHLIQTEVQPKVLDSWLKIWGETHDIGASVRAELRPHIAGSELLELTIRNESAQSLANVIFASYKDRKDKMILSVRDQNTDTSIRRKRLMLLAHLFLIYRYNVDSVHYVSPSDLNHKQADRMKDLGIYSDVHNEVGDIIVAHVDKDLAKKYQSNDLTEISKLIRKD
ncbi:isocitrate lyase/phosphoenolpyruvate mutase family protein [Pseudobacteriovorax antillogorgiicola]